MRHRFNSRIPAALALIMLAVAPLAAAQEASAPAGGALNLPANPTFLAKPLGAPRKATALVNGEIITATDVDQRVALVVSASGGKVSDEERERLHAQVLRNLIDETLEIQEAKQAEITIDDAEVNDAFGRVATGNFKQDVPALEAYLARIGSSGASLKRQIKGELAWQRVLRRNVQPFVNVSEIEVKELVERLKAAKGTEEFRLGEIYLSSTPESRASVGENARKIVEQLRAGGSFVAYARQYSEASTAAVGGDLGWIRLAQLPAELATAARELSPGQLVGPIETRGGFSILYLIDKRQVLTADPRDAVLSLKQIAVDFAPGTKEAENAKLADAFAAQLKAARGCGSIDAIAARLGAKVVSNEVKARDLPGPLQNAVLALGVGEATPPFGSLTEGVRVLMLCGRDDPKADNGPSVEELRQQMEDDRVNKRAQMYLRDLRRDAIIDYN